MYVKRHAEKIVQELSRMFRAAAVFYRDKDMNEIDLLIEGNGVLHPIEMKKHADPVRRDTDAFALLDKMIPVNYL